MRIERFLEFQIFYIHYLLLAKQIRQIAEILEVTIRKREEVKDRLSIGRKREVDQLSQCHELRCIY